MTLRRDPSTAPDRNPSPSVPQETNSRDPRAAVFVRGLVAASPSSEKRAFKTFARRIAERHSGEW